MEVLIGTTNKGKVKEFSLLLENFLPHNTKFSSLTSYPFIPDILEDGKSFLENSMIKAKSIFSHTHIPTLTDDSGLVIDALNGEPGIYSARYGEIIFGSPVDMPTVMKYILSQLEDTPVEQRTARFVCALTCITSNGNIYTAEGYMEGSIAYTIEENGYGFGYDSIFIPQGYTTTLACLPDTIKNSISHRYTALTQLITQIPAEEWQ